jgi:lysozyme
VDRAKLTKQLIEHEGMRLKPYKCTAGKLTIGVGRNLESNGILTDEAFLMLDNDISICEFDMNKLFYDFMEFPENVKLVLIDMRFQLGPSGFRKFKNMIIAAKEKDWSEMVMQMKDSAWYNQVPNRAQELIRMVQEVG